MVSTLVTTEETRGNSRELLLSVALELFTRKGYDATSIDDIRQAAGFKSKASLYTHFKSKEEVSTALLNKWQGEQTKAVFKAVEGSSSEPLQRFMAVSLAFIDWAILHPQEYAFCFLRVQQDKLMRGDYGYLGDTPADSYVLMINLLKSIREKYPVRQIADAALLSMVVGLVSKAVIDQESFGAISLEEKIRQIMEMCLGVLFSEAVKF